MLFQVVIAVVVGTEAHFHYLPSVYVIFALMFVQGLTEGANFRAAVFSLHKEVMEPYYAFPSDSQRFTIITIYSIILYKHQKEKKIKRINFDICIQHG